jgi:DNA-binding NarL/FixJ family response regulator
MRVVIADDHAVYREGLARLLRKFGVDVVGEAPDGEAAIRMVDQTAPDVVLLDLRMPGMSGLEAVRLLTDQAAAVRVLVLSVSADEADVTAAIVAGANGYVLKDEPVEEVIAGLQAAAADRARISPGRRALLGPVRGAIETGEDLAGGGPSTIKLQVLDLMAAGKADREVSERLSIGEDTVGDYYIRSIVTKLQVESRVRAARQCDSG